MAEEDKIYIQQADFSIVDVKEQSPEGAKKAFREFDWESEVKIQKKLEAEGKQPRTACLCLGTFGDDYYIEISPKDKVRAEIYYVRTTSAPKAKENKELSLPIKFGIFSPAKKILAKALANNSSVNEEVVKENYPIEQIEAIIDAYFTKNEAELLQLLQ